MVSWWPVNSSQHKCQTGSYARQRYIKHHHFELIIFERLLSNTEDNDNMADVVRPDYIHTHSYYTEHTFLAIVK